MADTTFTDQTTVISATWLNDVNDAAYGGIGDGVIAPTTATQVRTNLGLPASSGSSLIGFFPAGTGAVASTAQAKMRETVSVEDFGAVAYSTKAAALAGVDSTAAIVAALVTKLNIHFGAGFYAHTGGFVVGAQQHITGAGQKSGTNSTNGTTLVQKSGTSIAFDCNNSDSYIADLSLDANDLNAIQIRLDGCKYCIFERISFFNQGVDSYSLQNVPYQLGVYVSTTNLCTFNNLEFSPRTDFVSGGHLRLAGRMLYTTFNDCVFGDVGGTGFAIDVGDPSADAYQSQITFNQLACDGAINLGGVSPVAGIVFNGLRQEPSVNRVMLTIKNATTHTVYVRNYRSNISETAFTNASISVTDALNTVFEDAAIGDGYNVGVFRRTFFNLDGVDGFELRGAKCYSALVFDYVHMTGTTSKNVVIENAYSHISNNGRHIVKADQSIIFGGDVPVIFTAGNGICNNVGSAGSFTLANVGDYRNLANLSTKSTTFTGTLTGASTAPTGAITYKQVGNFVTLSIPGFTATSNAAAVTITGMTPAILYPAASAYSPCIISNNGGTKTIAVAIIGTGGVINLYTDVAQTGWTNGVMIVDPFVITYAIAST